MPHTILVPTDFSAASDEALRYAESLARQLNSSVISVYVESGDPATSHRLAKRHSELAESLSEVGPGVVATAQMRKLSVKGVDPAAEIVRVARSEKVDLIVMATSGNTGLRRLLLGSVAQAVLRNAPCAVMTVKLPGTLQAANLADDSGAESVGAAIDFAAVGNVSGTCTHAAMLVSRAIDARATDIHLDPAHDKIEVRFRVDGRLRHYCRLNRELGQSLMTQLKVMANVDIADPFHTAEGHLALTEVTGNYEARLTRVPVVGGESIAVRLFSASHLFRPLKELGLSAQTARQFEDMLKRGEGIVLVTGPAGAGKSTTAYSMIHALDNGERNIVTIEDPVEYHVPGFRQMSVDLRHAITMTSGLRTLLRMDPDVVLVGEIRDRETAEMAMRAASSGKYVFATLHTRDVASTITALRDLHVDNRSLGGNLTGVISQRLVRRLCPKCARRTAINSDQAVWFSSNEITPPAELPTPVGCDVCNESGYFERIGVFEVVIPDRETRAAIERGVPEDELREVLRAAGTASLVADGLRKVCDGITTLDEIKTMSWVSVAN